MRVERWIWHLVMHKGYILARDKIKGEHKQGTIQVVTTLKYINKT